MKGVRIPLVIALPFAVCVGAASCNSESLFPPLGGEPSPTPSVEPTPTPDPRPGSVRVESTAIEELTISWETGPFESYVVYLGTDAALVGSSWRDAAATAAPVQAPPHVAAVTGGKSWYVRVVAVDGGEETGGVGTLQIEPIGSGWNGLGPSEDSSAVWTQSGGAGESFGASVSGLRGSTGDDDYEEFVVGVPSASSGGGAIRLFLGSATGPESTFIERVGNGSEELGTSVSGADFDGDGYSDVVAGAPYYDDGDPLGPGAIHVFRGDPLNGLEAAPSFTGEGFIAGEANGFSVAAVGDYDGDGRSEVVAGTPTRQSALLREGGWYGWRSAATGTLESSPTEGADGEQGDAQMGTAVAGTDFNADGRADVVAAAPFWDGMDVGTQGIGRIQLWCGVATGALAFTAFLDGTEQFGFWGYALAGVGDVNGDTFEDLVIGAPQYGPDEQGSAFLRLGQSATPFQSASDWVPVSQADWTLGRAVTGADFNADGFSDVALGGPFADGATGRVVIHLGGPGGLQNESSFELSGAVGGDFFGQALGHADVNADGSADLIVGSESAGMGAGKVWLFYGPPRVGPGLELGGAQSAPIGVAVSLAGATVQANGMDVRLRCDVDWGDGSLPLAIESCTTATLEAAQHAYANPGIYAVHVTATSLGYGTTADAFMAVTVPES